MIDIADDLSVLTTIQKSAIIKLLDKESYIITNGIEENLLSNNPISEFDLGIGVLSILIDDKQIKYKFIPNTKLEKAIKKTVSNKKSPLKDSLEKTLVNKIPNIYKELL